MKTFERKFTRFRIRRVVEIRALMVNDISFVTFIKNLFLYFINHNFEFILYIKVPVLFFQMIASIFEYYIMNVTFKNHPQEGFVYQLHLGSPRETLLVSFK